MKIITSLLVVCCSILFNITHTKISNSLENPSSTFIEPASTDSFSNSTNFQTGSIQDTFINYCKIVKGAYYYGTLAGREELTLTDDEAKYFNGLWQGSFSEPYYQTGIGVQEFSSVHKFREGKKDPFPPSFLYHQWNPDIYKLFHIVKEIGKIKSPSFGSCEECVTESISKINTLLERTHLHRQVSDLWVGPGVLKKITNTNEINELWLFIRCLFIDDLIYPKIQPVTVNLKPLVSCPDTTIINCKNEIVPEVSVRWRHCEVGGKIDTVGPKLIKGIDNCPGAIYQIIFAVKDQCLQIDTCRQFFKIENDPPKITCPKDTVVFCIEDLSIHKAITSSSCNVTRKPSTYGPLLLSGTNNCPDAIYELQYSVKDICGRETKCIQKITIDNDPPTIKCPPDKTVECFEDIVVGTPLITVSCSLGRKIEDFGPTLVQGQGNCPGTVYEIKYKVTDVCGRSDSCIQKFVIDNDGPIIKCPDDKMVKCVDEINTSKPFIDIACHMGYTVNISDPVHEFGTPGCPGAIYSLRYLVTDECGRTDACEQLFTIMDYDIDVDCPPDRIVECKEDILPEPPKVSIACANHYDIETSEIQLISGEDNCPGAIYRIFYVVKDKCGKEVECRQMFTLKDHTPEIICPPDREIVSLEAFVKETAKVNVACGLDYLIDVKLPPKLISGVHNCPGAVYEVVYEVTDMCGGKASCIQRLTIKDRNIEVNCPPDITVECIEEFNPQSTTSWLFGEVNLNSSSGPKLIFGKPHCTGAVYEFTYYFEDECNEVVKCIQRITIKNNGPKIECPPDVTISSIDEWFNKSPKIKVSCGMQPLLDIGPLNLVSGVYGQSGSVYRVKYTAVDKCDRKDECIQRVYLEKVAAIEPCNISNASLVETSPGNYDCNCDPGYKFTADKSLCVPYEDCTLISNSREVYTGARYKCDCLPGYKWDPDGSACVPYSDCSSIQNTHQVFNGSRYVCECLPGYEWDANQSKCKLAGEEKTLWVLDGGPIINPNNLSTRNEGGGNTPGFYTEPRYKGFLHHFSVSETNFSFRSRDENNGVLYHDVTFKVNFTKPPSQLDPGQVVPLRASLSHSGGIYKPSRPGIRFNYKADGTTLADIVYDPFYENWNGQSNISCEYKTPPVTPNGELRIIAIMPGNGIPCHVEWVYRPKVVTTTTLSHQRSGEEQYDIPILRANVETIKFFESGKDVMSKNLRKYQNNFVSSETRYINYELNISYPSPRKRIDFDIVAKWYDSDGNEYAKYSRSSHINSDWKSSNHSDGWGTKNGGYWKPGKYRLELYVANKKVASQSIEVVDAHPFYAGAYQIPEISGSAGDFRFYEGGTSGVSKKERHYTAEFSKSSTRYVFWEVSLLHDKFEKQFNIDIEAIYIKSNGETFGSHVKNTRIPPGASSSIHTHGLGWNESGKWPPGNYRVVFKVAGNSVGTEYFTIK